MWEALQSRILRTRLLHDDRLYVGMNRTKTLKRLFDIALVLFSAPLALVVILVAAIIVRAGSPGPALFRQRRVGFGERQFTLFKLRTMLIDMDDRPSHEASPAQVTKSGRVFRRLKIDELPQLWNVLTGSMSLVGPRPCLPGQRALITARRASNAFSVRPGITGPAQLAGIDMSTPERLAEVDGTYAHRNNLCGDIRLVIQTITGGGRYDGVGRAVDRDGSI